MNECMRTSLLDVVLMATGIAVWTTMLISAVAVGLRLMSIWWADKMVAAQRRADRKAREQ